MKGCGRLGTLVRKRLRVDVRTQTREAIEPKRLNT